jgi:hypothetical protein
MSTFQPESVTAAFPVRRGAAVRCMLEAVVTDQPRADRRHRLTVIAVCSAALVLAACASAVAYVHASAPVTDTSQARCYTKASLAGGTNFAGTSVALTQRNELRPASRTRSTSARRCGVRVCSLLERWASAGQSAESTMSRRWWPVSCRTEPPPSSPVTRTPASNSVCPVPPASPRLRGLAPDGTISATKSRQQSPPRWLVLSGLLGR